MGDRKIPNYSIVFASERKYGKLYANGADRTRSLMRCWETPPRLRVAGKIIDIPKRVTGVIAAGGKCIFGSEDVVL